MELKDEFIVKNVSEVVALMDIVPSYMVIILNIALYNQVVFIDFYPMN